MSTEYKRMQQRHGSDSDFQSEMANGRLLPAEFQIITSGASTDSGKACYYATGNNTAIRLLQEDDDITASAVGEDGVDTAAIQDEAVTLPKLSNELQDFISDTEATTAASCVFYSTSVSSMSDLNTATLLRIGLHAFLTASGDVANRFNVSSGTVITMTVSGTADKVVRIVTTPTNIKAYSQIITQSGGSTSYGSWNDIAITYDDLDLDLQNTIDSINTLYDYAAQILDVTATSVSDLNLAAYGDETNIINVALTSYAATDFEVESGTVGIMFTILANNTRKRFMLFPDYPGLQWTQVINSIAPYWSAGNWVKHDLSEEIENNIAKPTYNLLFDGEGRVGRYAESDSVNHMIYAHPVGYNGYDTDTIEGIYYSPSSTRIAASVYTAYPNLNKLYVDVESADDITIDSTIADAIENGDIDIYYRGQFNLANLIIPSLTKPDDITISDDSTVALRDDRNYIGTGINTITFTYPQSGSYECNIRLTFASSGTITVTFPTSQYIGSTPTFANGETWEISIKNGVIIAGKVTSGS